MDCTGGGGGGKGGTDADAGTAGAGGTDALPLPLSLCAALAATFALPCGTFVAMEGPTMGRVTSSPALSLSIWAAGTV